MSVETVAQPTQTMEQFLDSLGSEAASMMDAASKSTPPVGQYTMVVLDIRGSTQEKYRRKWPIISIDLECRTSPSGNTMCVGKRYTKSFFGSPRSEDQVEEVLKSGTIDMGELKKWLSKVLGVKGSAKELLAVAHQSLRGAHIEAVVVEKSGYENFKLKGRIG